MSFARNTVKFSIISTLILCSPALFAKSVPNNNVFINEESLDGEGDDSLEDFYGDEDFVSIATGSKQLIHKAPSTATVITANDIKRMGAQTVFEALESVPGLHVYPSPFNRLNVSFSIRGIHTDQNPQVLFLINGAPVREEYTGARPQTFKMPVHAVSRIEIIRGPGSAIYGADAYAGVINVITKDLTETNDVLFGASYGSFNSTNAWYQNNFTIKELILGFSLETLRSDGDKNRVFKRDLQSIFDDLLGTSASKAPAALNTDYNILDFRANVEFDGVKSNFWYWNNKNAGQGAGAAQAIDPSGFQDTSIYQFDINYDWKISTWDANIQYGFYKMLDKATFSVLPAGTLVPLGVDGNLNLVSPIGIGLFVDGFLGNPQPTETLNSLDFSLLSNDFTEHKIRVGTGISQRKLTADEEKNFGPGVINTQKLTELFSNGNIMVIDGALTDVSNTSFVFVKNVDRTNVYLSLQDQWQFANDWELTAGIRYDNYSDFGTTVNPRLALVWEVNHGISAKFLYGRAYRAPAFDTLYAINNPVGIGNPNLKPETIDTFEMSLNQHFQDDFSWSINFFSYQSKDLIEFVPDVGATTTTAQNARKQNGYGFEAETAWKTHLGLWSFNYSWQHSEDKSTGIKIPMAPQQLVNVMYDKDFSENLSFTAKYNWVGERSREVGDLRHKLNNYGILNIALHWSLDISQSWELSVLGKNILNKSAFEPTHPLVPDALGPISDYPIQGRSIYFQIAKNW